MHITGSWVEFCKFFNFFQGKSSFFSRPHPVFDTFFLIYRRFFYPFSLKHLPFLQT